MAPTLRWGTPVPAFTPPTAEHVAAVRRRWFNEEEPMEDATPKPKFSFAWVDDNNADVFVTIKGDDQVFRIGLLCWVNDTWLFQRITPKNEQVGGGAFCCDEEKEAEFREREAQTRVESAVAPYSVLQARLAALSIEREQYRDDSREIAESGATLQARKWWRQFWHELNEYDD